MKEINEHIENLLYNYFIGDLSEQQERELVEWLDADESHKKVLAEMSDWWAIAHIPLFVSNRKADFEKHFSTLMEPVIPQRKLTMRFSNVARVAAVVLLLLTTGIISYYVGMGIQVKNETLAWFETEVPLGSQSKITLPDQSIVWINAGSTLRYSNEFNDKNREIYLDGEAYFDVVTDTLKPFIVKSGDVDIRVLGTRFNVKAYKDDAMLDVSLVSGKVNVAFQNRDDQINEVELQPNRMLSYNKDIEAVTMSEVNGEYAYEWTKGIFRFNEQYFGQLAKVLERKYNVRIYIESERLKEEVFTGSFSKQYTLNEILREVDVDHKYSWEQEGDAFYIRDKIK